MAARIPQIVRVYLSRPWVWLMGAMGLFQIFPAVLMSRSGASMSPVVVAPDLQGEERPVSQLVDFTEHLEKGTLGSLTAIDITDYGEPHLPLGRLRVKRDEKGGRVIESLDGAADPMLFISPNSMSLLTHVPHLKSFRANIRIFDLLAWTRLGELKELESLSLRKSGCSDSAALEAAPVEVPAMLSKLTNLRDLDLLGAFSPKIMLPPMPRLERLGIGPLLNLTPQLKKLKENSPQIRVLILGAYWEHESVADLAEALKSMPHLRQVYLMDLPPNSTIRSELAERVPGVSFPRTVYSPVRVYGALYLAIACSFPCMIVWMQTLVCFSMAYSQTMPRFRWPHLAIPLAVTAVLVPAGCLFARYLGIAWAPALTLVYSGSLFTTMPQPNLDATPLATLATRALATWRVGLGASLMALTFANPALMDAFYAGDFPLVYILLLTIETLGTFWAIRRMFRQASVLAELGQTVIPGLIQLDHFNLQMNPESARKKKAFWLDSQGADDRLEALLESRHRPIGALMRAGTPRISWGPRLIVLLFLCGVFLVTFRHTAKFDWRERLFQAAPIAAAQAGLVFVMWSFAQWIGRRPALSMELVRPMSRDRYFRGLWQATAIDIGQVVLMIAIGALIGLLAYGFGFVSCLLAVLGLLGIFMTIHGILLWALTARQLWIPLTIGLAMFIVAAPMGAFVMQMVNGNRDMALAEGVPRLLGAMTLLFGTIGTGLQFWQIRRWQTVELP